MPAAPNAVQEPDQRLHPPKTTPRNGSRPARQLAKGSATISGMTLTTGLMRVLMSLNKHSSRHQVRKHQHQWRRRLRRRLLQLRRHRRVGQCEAKCRL